MYRGLNESDVIQCHNIESEIWSRIAKFENEFYVRNYFPDRLKVLQVINDHFEHLNTNKEKFKNENRQIRSLDLLSTQTVTDELLLRITNTAKQAREFYGAAQTLPLLTKPILVMYAFEKLAELLVLTTFDLLSFEKKSVKRYTHGLSYEDDDSFLVKVKSNGLFNIFHDCYDSNLKSMLNRMRLS